MTRTLTDAAAGSLDIRGDAWWEDPDGNFAKAREQGWLFTSDRGFEILGYQHVPAFLRHRSMAQEHVRFTSRSGITDPEVKRFRAEFLNAQPGKSHTRIRASVAQYFASAKVETLRSVVHQIIQDLFDEVSDPANVDLKALSELIPARLYLHMVGRDTRDHDLARFVIEASDSIVKIFREDPALKDEIENAFLQALALTENLLDERTGHVSLDRGDLLDHVTHACDEGLISRQEAIDLLTLTLEGSTDNTFSQMLLTLSALLEHPDQWHTLVGNVDDDRLLANASEEGIRYRPRIVGLRKTAFEDFEYDGISVPAETDFYMSITSAHRDPTAFADPDRFDITRDFGRARTMQFGGGMNVCLGQVLARMENVEFLRVVAQRFPHLKLTQPFTPMYPGPSRAVAVPPSMWVSLEG